MRKKLVGGCECGGGWGVGSDHIYILICIFFKCYHIVSVVSVIYVCFVCYFHSFNTLRSSYINYMFVHFCPFYR